MLLLLYYDDRIAADLTRKEALLEGLQGTQREAKTSRAVTTWQRPT